MHPAVLGSPMDLTCAPTDLDGEQTPLSQLQGRGSLIPSAPLQPVENNPSILRAWVSSLAPAQQTAIFGDAAIARRTVDAKLEFVRAILNSTNLSSDEKWSCIHMFVARGDAWSPTILNLSSNQP